MAADDTTPPTLVRSKEEEDRPGDAAREERGLLTAVTAVYLGVMVGTTHPAPSAGSRTCRSAPSGSTSWFDIRLAFANAFGNAVQYMEDDYLVAERESPWDYRNLIGNAALPGWSPNPDMRWMMTAAHGWLWWILCVAFLLGIPVIWLLPGPTRLVWIALLYMPMSYVFLASAVEFYMPRYNAAVSPIVAVVAVATVGAVWTRLRRFCAASGLP